MSTNPQQIKDTFNPQHPVPKSIMGYATKTIYDLIKDVYRPVELDGYERKEVSKFQSNYPVYIRTICTSIRWINLNYEYVMDSSLEFHYDPILLDTSGELLPLINSIVNSVISPSWSNYSIYISQISVDNMDLTIKYLPIQKKMSTFTKSVV